MQFNCSAFTEFTLVIYILIDFWRNFRFGSLETLSCLYLYYLTVLESENFCQGCALIFRCSHSEGCTSLDYEVRSILEVISDEENDISLS